MSCHLEIPPSNGVLWYERIDARYALPVTAFHRDPSASRWLQRDAEFEIERASFIASCSSGGVAEDALTTFTDLFDRRFWSEVNVPSRPGPLLADWRGAPLHSDLLPAMMMVQDVSTSALSVVREGGWNSDVSLVADPGREDRIIGDGCRFIGQTSLQRKRRRGGSVIGNDSVEGGYEGRGAGQEGGEQHPELVDDGDGREREVVSGEGDDRATRHKYEDDQYPFMKKKSRARSTWVSDAESHGLKWKPVSGVVYM